MTEQAQGIDKNRKLGGQLATAGAALIAASLVLAMLGILGGSPSNVMLAGGLVIGVVGMILSRSGRK